MRGLVILFVFFFRGRTTLLPIVALLFFLDPDLVVLSPRRFSKG